MCAMNVDLIDRRAILPALLITTLAACSSNNSTSPSPDANSLAWASCTEVAAMFECASLSVPMDYDQPEGEHIEIALLRSPATGTDRLGSLFVNAGGASGPGVEDVQNIISDRRLPHSILAAYDIVGFDPRGVGGSTPVDCSDVADADFNYYPSNADQIAQVHADYAEFSTACVAKYGDYLQLLGSLNIVRDLEEIRIAMGEDKVNFLAYSFSSRVAALYLQEFPETSGRMVLDASVSPDSSLRIVLSDPLPLMQAALASALAECRTTDLSCDPDALATELATRLNTLAASDSEANRDELDFILEFLFIAVEDSEFGRFLSPAIVEYINTLDTSSLQAIADNFFGSDESEQDDADGDHFAGDDGAAVDNGLYCADDSFRPDVEDLLSASNEFNQRSDIFAETSVSELSRCAGWPEALEPLAPIVTSTAPVSIVIGGTNDAVAPIELSEEMARAIGGVFLRSDHTGHISVFEEKSDCVDNVVEAFLLDGTIPAVQECSR